MKLYKVKAIVLSSREMREADRVLTIFSREQGKLRVVAHGVSKPASRKRGSVQPFCYTDFLLNRGREIDSVSQCQVLEIFSPLREDLTRLTYASYLAELVDNLTGEGEANQAVFALLLTCLARLAETGGDPELVARSFEARLAVLLGYRPRLDVCVNCQSEVKGQVAFSSRLGGLVCQVCRTACSDAVLLSRGSLEALKLLLDQQPSISLRLRPNQEMRHQLRQVLQNYLQYHLERKSKSMRFLDQILR